MHRAINLSRVAAETQLGEIILELSKSNPQTYKFEERGWGRILPRELDPDETLSGVVLPLPMHNAHEGRWLFLQPDGGPIIKIPAAASKGHTTLVTELVKRNVQVGDLISVHFRGWHTRWEGKQRFRSYRVRCLVRQEFCLRCGDPRTSWDPEPECQYHGDRIWEAGQ
jgi:hypothetical protein